MRVRAYLPLVAVVAACVLAAGAVTAFAQTPTTQTPPPSAAATGTIKPAPLAEGIYQVQAAPDVTAGQAAVIVAVQLPPDVKLPAMVRIPVPQGAIPTWVGEILGGDPTADPQREYRTAQGTGGQVLEMTLEETRSAQAEFTVSSTASGGKVTMSLNWIQSSPSEQTEFSVRTPPGSTQVQITPAPEGEPATNSLGETLYALPTKVMKAGETLVVSVSYVTGQGGQQGQAGTQSGSSTIFYVLVAALFLVLAVLGFSLLSRRSREE
jgi:hypothetical protein